MNDVTGISFNKNLEWFKFTLANGEEIDLVKKKDYLKLQQENQRLKERIEYLQRSISRKEETIKNLQNELVETPKEVELENRIDKAIEYIENCDPDNLNSMFLNESYISNYGACELLKILKGENND